MPSLKYDITIILPCYNPIPGWENIVFEAYTSICRQIPNNSVEICIVNDGSTHSVSDEAINYLQEKIKYFCYLSLSNNYGKGFAVRYGMKHSLANAYVFTDIDFPYLNKNLVTMCKNVLEGNADIIIGQRENKYYKKIPFFRKLVSKILKKTISILFQFSIVDTQGGLKAFSEKGKKVLLSTKTDRYLFDLELVKQAVKNDTIVLKQIEISLKEDIQLSSLSLKILLTEFKNLYKIWRI